MSIPLVQNNEKDSINTSIIAIKRNIERINMLLGLSNSEEIDTSEFVKKSDIVDEVTVGNMHSVSSNAVAKALSYSTEEVFTGKYWIDGKKIYRKVFANLPVVNDTVLVTGVSNLIQVGGYYISGAYAKIALPYGSPGSITSAYIKNGETQIRITTNQSVTVYITLEYTKTTD